MMTVADLKKITKGRLIQEGRPTVLKGISIDSRTISKGCVFIAIKGNRVNGHKYVQTAVRKGAAVVIVSQRVSCSDKVSVICVKDTTLALGQIAGWHRRQFDIPVIAITGSTGKTTTKELIASVLGTRYKVLKNAKTENNQFGVPLTLLKMNNQHEMVVLECGTNQAGDIAHLARIARPTTVVLTNIGESHLAGLKNPQGVFREKIQILKYQEPKGSVILNGDDPFLSSASKRKYGKNVIRYGYGRKCDVQASRVILRNNRCLEFSVRHKLFTIKSPAQHNIYNALAAISCGAHYKIRYNKIKSALARFQFRGGRQEIIKQGRYWFIDDTYNANPVSLNSAVHTLDTLSIQGKRIIVCADMLELGAHSVNCHRLAGRMLAQSEADVVLTVGPHARYITESLRRTGNGIEAKHCRNIGEVHRRLRSCTHPGDAVLVKGSRAMHMERTVAFLKAHFK